MKIKKKILVRRRSTPPAVGWTGDRMIGVLMNKGERGFTNRELMKEYKIKDGDMEFQSAIVHMYMKLQTTRNVRSEWVPLKGPMLPAQELRYYYVRTPDAV
jgi:hypothetical protein